MFAAVLMLVVMNKYISEHCHNLVVKRSMFMCLSLNIRYLVEAL